MYDRDGVIMSWWYLVILLVRTCMIQRVLWCLCSSGFYYCDVMCWRLDDGWGRGRRRTTWGQVTNVGTNSMQCTRVAICWDLFFGLVLLYYHMISHDITWFTWYKTTWSVLILKSVFPIVCSPSIILTRYGIEARVSWPLMKVPGRGSGRAMPKQRRSRTLGFTWCGPARVDEQSKKVISRINITKNIQINSVIPRVYLVEACENIGKRWFEPIWGLDGVCRVDWMEAKGNGLRTWCKWQVNAGLGNL